MVLARLPRRRGTSGERSVWPASKPRVITPPPAIASTAPRDSLATVTPCTRRGEQPRNPQPRCLPAIHHQATCERRADRHQAAEVVLVEQRSEDGRRSPGRIVQPVEGGRRRASSWMPTTSAGARTRRDGGEHAEAAALGGRHPQASAQRAPSRMMKNVSARSEPGDRA